MKYSVDTRFQSLADIIIRLNPVELVTPINVADEKARWLDRAKIGLFTNPYFLYNREALKEASSHNFELTAARATLANGLIPETDAEKVIKKILLSRINNAITATEIAASILLGDDNEVCNLSRKIYGFPSNNQAYRAYQIVNGEIIPYAKKSRFTKKDQKALKAMQFDAETIGYWFTEVINHYGIDSWTIEVGDQFTSIDVRDKNLTGRPLVGVPATRKVNGLKLLELIGHEIECHLLGSENCKELVKQILGADSPLAPLYPVIAKSDDELFYEGVAKISDVSINGPEALPMPYATIACDQARRGSDFAEIAKLIKDMRFDMGQTEEEALKGAWTTTYRIMRGSTNTELGGYSFSKDYVYMGGYDIAQQVSPLFRSFASMTLDEITALAAVCELKPTYTNLDAVGYVKWQLLS